MWPKIKNSFRKFFYDEAYFTGLWDRWVAKVRGLIMGAGAAVLAYGDKLEASVPPSLQGKVRIGGVCLMGFSLMLRAGDKNPKPEEKL